MESIVFSSTDSPTIKISEVLAGNRKNSAGFIFKYK